MPIASPDRFVPSRVPLQDRFRATKQAHELSPSERLHRTEDSASDVFCFASMRSALIPARRASRSDGVERQAGAILSPDSSGRQVSNGAVWSVGGLAPGGVGVDDGRGQRMRSGSNARYYTTSFADAQPRSEDEQERHEGRLALALDINRIQRMLDFGQYSTFPRCKRNAIPLPLQGTRTIWTGSGWSNGCHTSNTRREERLLPNAPFKVLDAPGLRDDFYCSIMAYSRTRNVLAVGLGNLLYAWSEPMGVTLLNAGLQDGSWLTSVAFSSDEGDKSILAFGRSSGMLFLMSLLDGRPPSSFSGVCPRFKIHQPAPVACLSWRPAVALRPSRSELNPGVLVKTEDLLEVARENWRGTMTLLARIKVHSQQICGLAWSPGGEQFATGSNDNLCCLFNVDRIIDTRTSPGSPAPSANNFRSDGGEPTALPYTINPGNGGSSPGTRADDLGFLPVQRQFPVGSEQHRWRHGAAVKAIAFCPWRQGLIATGGGSNDKCIHFYHTRSGAALATISVAAQVTSLIWSTTRREIAATFGYAHPDHPYRIAVFSWPDCRQVAAVPWEGEHRALYAIPYPGGPREACRARDRSRSRTAEEGCIVVASSDESIKFHEVWVAYRKATTLGSGILGGSDILEMGEGIDKEGDVIR
ncbi:WD40 repeat-like protein [Durotheca rogersii]|uniref:WD40 repeat-like protein n=1 Tax=Durotheca rogersii TaxID=419775 RepID=UPI002220FDC1|nr:WD40 repeat-like protein [Durotheca rogersii]KAI5855539.1 WD40 repeat-like protein [Durotheca rogersii]